MKNYKKKFFILLLLPILTLVCFLIQPNILPTVFCDDEMRASEIQEEIQKSVESQLGDLSFEGFDEILKSISSSGQSLFGADNFLEKIKSILNGEFKTNQQNIWSAIFNLFFEDVLSFLPLMSVVIAISITFSFVSSSRGKSKNKSIGDIIHFVCFGVIIITLIGTVINMFKMTSTTILTVKKQMDIAFPILLTILTAVGGTVSVSVYQPAVAILSGSITTIFTSVLMPIFVFQLVFSIVANISNNIKLDKFAGFFSSLFKWIIGGMFTIFSAFLTLQGISAGSVDGISFRTEKYAIKNSVPIVGSYISDGLNLIVASSVLIKNAVGVGGLILLFSTILIPILKLIVFMLALKLTSAILEPLTDSKISKFVEMLSKSVSLLIVVIISISFMYILLSGLIILSANFI